MMAVAVMIGSVVAFFASLGVYLVVDINVAQAVIIYLSFGSMVAYYLMSRAEAPKPFRATASHAK